MTEKKESEVDMNPAQRSAYVAVGLVSVIIIMSVFFPMFVVSFGSTKFTDSCQQSCRLVITITNINKIYLYLVIF